MSQTPAPAPPTDDGLPPHGVRTIVNFLLFVHLFTVGVLMLFAGSNSGLRFQLRRLPGYYLQVLGMEVDFDSGQRYNLGLEYDEIKDRLENIAEHVKYIEEDPGRRHAADTDLTFVIDRQKESPRDASRRGLFHLTHGGALDAPHFIELHYRPFLFAAPLGPESELSAGRVPDPLREAFHDNDEQLPEAVSVSVVEAGRVWQIDTARTRYVARKVAEELNIHRYLLARFPNEQLWPYQRYLRFRMLAREVARLVAVEDVQDVLPAALTEGIARSGGVSFEELSRGEPRFVCRRRITQQELEWRRQQLGIEPHPDPEHEYWYRTVYQRTPLAINGRIRFNKIERNTRDYAPPVGEKINGRKGGGK